MSFLRFWEDISNFCIGMLAAQFDRCFEFWLVCVLISEQELIPIRISTKNSRQNLGGCGVRVSQPAVTAAQHRK